MCRETPIYLITIKTPVLVISFSKKIVFFVDSENTHMYRCQYSERVLLN